MDSFVSGRYGVIHEFFSVHEYNRIPSTQYIEQASGFRDYDFHQETDATNGSSIHVNYFVICNQIKWFSTLEMCT
jgi:hypothetical protein